MLWIEPWGDKVNINILALAALGTTLLLITVLFVVRCAVLSFRLTRLHTVRLCTQENVIIGFYMCLPPTLCCPFFTTNSGVLRLGQCSNDAMFDRILGQMLNWGEFTERPFDPKVPWCPKRCPQHATHSATHFSCVFHLSQSHFKSSMMFHANLFSN